MSSAGNWKIDVARGGYPVWCVLRYSDREIQVRHTDLQDLRYAAERAIKECRDALPDSHRREMD